MDASALLAFLFAEPGSDRVRKVIHDACMSTVNLSEVLGRFSRDGHDPQRVMERLMTSGLQFVPFGSQEAAEAAALVPATRPFGLSLGDRACLALAKLRRLPVLTADRVWLDLDLGLQVDSLR